MDWLNYHHLLYFWVAARHGGITKAAKLLSLSQPTLSGQIRQLEQHLGVKLFRRAGRQLELTEDGRLVYRYADEIFGLGRELLDAVRGQPAGRPLRLVVGVADVLPKLVVARLLQPALRLPHPLQLVVKEEQLDRLLGDLAVHALDLVLADSPIAPNVNVRAYNHLLGESTVSFFAAPDLARSLASRRFPESLDSTPFLFPGKHTVLRRALDAWLDARELRPIIVGEFDDSALAASFGASGAGVFVGPTAIGGELVAQYGVTELGQAKDLTERVYAISVERRIKHPGVIAISEAGRRWLER